MDCLQRKKGSKYSKIVVDKVIYTVLVYNHRKGTRKGNEMKRNQFKAKMEKLTTDEIKDFIVRTWNESVGGFFREIGLEVIEDREGEDASDKIYAELWKICEA